MTVDSMEELSGAFAQWRGKKRHPREEMPAELLDRARRAASVHGVNRVARALKVDRRRLEPPSARAHRGNGRRTDIATPAYSRVQLMGPTPRTAHPFAELEAPGGVKLRLFVASPEALGLLSSLLSGGAR